MGTPCTAVLVDNDVLHMAHIGDSRAYRLKNDVFEQLSADHTFVQRLIDEGRIQPEDAESHPHKNVLMRVLGDVDRSEEHTSELQSRGHLVCRLLLEKKKKQKKQENNT